MKQLIFRSIFFAGLLLLFTACEEQNMTFLPSGESSFPSGDRVEAGFYGRLLDQNLEPVVDAQVWIGDRLAVSDSLGDWIIPKVEVVSRQAYIKVEATGYFAASRVTTALSNSMNLVRIMPTKKTAFTSSSIQSDQGGVIQLTDGSSVSFQPGSFISESSGALYTGEVKVYSYSIDGQSEASQLQMPGRLESITEDAALISLGMVVTDLESPSGEVLQLKEGMPATIRYEQANLDANAPDTIPLWHFDEGMGTWVKDGFSVRDGNTYVGEVSHFTWWNCDWPEDLIDFCIQFSCIDSIPTLAGRSTGNDKYCITGIISSDRWGARRVTAAMGEDLKFCSVLPANFDVTFRLHGKDGESFDFGPFSTGAEDKDFGVHEVDCNKLDPNCSSSFPTPPVPRGQPTPPRPPGPVVATLTWSAADCADVGGDLLLRIASTARNSTPTIISQPFSQGNSATVSLPANETAFVTILDPITGEVLGRKGVFPSRRIELGSINTNTGIFDAAGYEVKGRLRGCDAGLADVTVRLLSSDGTLIDETKSSPTGIFRLNTTPCDGRSISVKIFSAEGEQVMASELFDDLDFGDIPICAADGNYYWRAKINGQQFSYLTCNGRAGTDGWVAYGADEPSPTSPFFGIIHSGQVVRAGTFQVDPDGPIKFNGFRLGQYNFTRISHPFEGELKVSEFGSIASGIFTGTCVNSDGETVDLEVEMRFVKP